MRSPLFPKKINPWQLTASNGRLEGELALAALPRLGASNRADGRVSVSLEGGVDDRVRFLKGRLRADVELVCQRCLGPLLLPLELGVALGLVRSEAEAARLPAGYEPLLATDDGISVAELVEDELLLALPQIPRHQDLRECEANGYPAPREASSRAERRRPFAALASLLADSKRST
ncbi:MAG TPA: YceD family protein [Candidatus Competibacter sp.]|mgnify:CR=1 FL=1|nr:hypothetical protein [Candidatus Competibacteraceae bacterium]HRC72768.1 YceD family protein [Candidatus Competibacter sp.]